MTNDSASTLVFLGIPSLAALIVGLLTIATAVAERKLGTALALANRRAVRNALLAVIWVAVSLGVANTGVLARFDSRPPPLLVFLVLAFSGTIALARSRFGERLTLGLPLWRWLDSKPSVCRSSSCCIRPRRTGSCRSRCRTRA